IWARIHKESLNSRKSILKDELADLDGVIDKGKGSDADGHRRREVVRLIQEVEKVDAMEVAQKAKIKWSIEGDENSKYYHGVLNKKIGRLTIRGVLVDGIWMESPHLVKHEFFEHFKNRFEKPNKSRILLDMDFVKRISLEQNDDLEREVTNEEIKREVYFEKAYDSVRWDFIDDILRRFNFGEKWCQWSQCNIDTIIRVLDVFYHASGLRINMSKSNLMGISVDSNKVKHAAAKIESIHARFFSGADVNSQKPIWVRWKSVLAAKDVVGLGNSLWVRVVKALHGEDGKIGKKVQPRYPSTWLNIINEIKSLKLHGIDLVSFITPKLGNGDNTSFWVVAWCADIAFKNLVLRLYALESMKNIEVVSKLSHGGLKFSFRRNPRGGVEQTQFERLKEMVEGVTLSN
nr:RNA-directed DNA polymerase, eukaryota, reverse transcriptase zinc-binding domain protein [Tanacetum cinerariifolium]